MLTVKLRYKDPDGARSRLLTFAVRDEGKTAAQAGADFRFAAAVASFGMPLRDSPHKGTYTMDGVIELASSSLGADESPYRAEFLDLARTARKLMSK